MNSSQSSLIRLNQPRGLYNLGNSCYLNSLLQCLGSNEGLRAAIQHQVSCNHSKQTACTECALSRLFSLLHDPDNAVSPVYPTEVVEMMTRSLPLGRQHDAHEAFHILAQSTPHHGSSSVLAHRGVFESRFGFFSYTTLICSECGRVTHKQEWNLDLVLSVNDETSLENCLRSHFASCEVSGDVYCERCCRRTRTFTEASVEEGPETLVICLRRANVRMKVARHVEFTKHLEMTDYLTITMGQRTAFYTLSAFVVHDGSSPSSGHYRAFAHVCGKWFECNDHTITMVAESNAFAQCGYLFFYDRFFPTIGGGSEPFDTPNLVREVDDLMDVEDDTLSLEWKSPRSLRPSDGSDVSM